ncbi:MAG: RNA polymerase sigma factor [Candidatus Polarisedimenticolia bacterium]
MLEDPTGRGSRGPVDSSISPLESSAELLRRARDGDSQALNSLCERIIPPLKRWARHRLPSWARDLVDTDDLVQEAVLGTIHQIENFEPHHQGAIHAYLRQALQSRMLNELRRARRHPHSDAIEGDGQLDPSPSPLEAAIGHEALARYESALQRLRPDEREAIVARVEMGMGYAELAQAIGKPTPDAARVAVGRALLRLAQEMRYERTR